MDDQTMNVAQALNGQWHKLAAALLDIATREHGAGARPCVDITMDDIRRLDGLVIVATEHAGDAGERPCLRLELVTQREADEREQAWRQR